jgi:hypothetical protein
VLSPTIQISDEFNYRGHCETAWNWLRTGECWGVMGNSQGRDNVKKRAARRKKTERLAAAKAKKKKAAK